MLRYPIQAMAAVLVAGCLALTPRGVAAASLEDLRSALSAAVEQSRLLFGRTQELRQGIEGEGDPSGLHVERLSVAIQGKPLPLRAFSNFVPTAVKEQSRERMRAFIAGNARLAPRDARARGGLGLESRGLAMGSDRRLSERTSAGVALGYASAASGGGPQAGFEMETISLYGAHVRGPLSLEALVGSGRTWFRRAEEVEADGAILFAGLGSRWDWHPVETLTLSSSLRLNYGAVDPCAGQALDRLGLSTGLAAHYRLNTTWGMVTPWISAELRHQIYRSDVPGSGRGSLPAGQGITPRRKPVTAIRLGVVAELDRGGRFTVDHASLRDEWGASVHTVNARVLWRF